MSKHSFSLTHGSSKNRLLIILFCLIQFGAKATTVPGSTLSSAHWTMAGSPYLITGHIIVANNDSLVIDSGVLVEFQGKYKLFCNGKILANGTAGHPIIFTVPAANRTIGWLGIRYDNTPATNGSSFFKYCTLEYGHADATGDNMGGAFYFNNFSNCQISNCILQNNYATSGGAISARNSSPTLLRDSFYNNSSYILGACLDLNYSSSTIDGCLFVDAGITSTYSTLIISNNHFFHCRGEGGVANYANGNTYFSQILNNVFDSCSQTNGGGGGAILLSNAQAKIEHNIFRNNISGSGGGAISCWTQSVYPNSSSTIISNNLFFGNKAHIVPGAGAAFGGGAIYFSNCSGTVMNNTIVNNYSDTAGGAIFCNISSSPSFYNNIIFNNNVRAGVENIYILDNSSDPNFYNNDLEGGYAAINTNGTPLVGANVNNISSTPGFTNAAANIYTLNAGSSCVDAGISSSISSIVPTTDLAGNPRIIGAAIDIGAYETTGTTTGVNQFARSSFRVVPNPVQGYFEIAGANLNEIKSVAIYDVVGKQLAHYENSIVNHFDISNIASGIVIVCITDKKEQVNVIRILKN